MLSASVRKNTINNYKGILFLLTIGALVPLFIREPFILSILIQYLLYAYLGQCWDIIGGYAGQVSIGNAAFFGIGAYTSAVLFSFYGVSPWIAMWIGALLAVGFSFAMGYPCFRVGIISLFFAFFTFAYSEILRIIINASAFIPELAFLGGEDGFTIKVVPGDWATQLWNMQFFGRERYIPYYYIMLGLVIVALLVVSFIEKSWFGYYLKAIRANESVAKSLGINVLKYKLYAFALSASLTAISGTVYAFCIGHIDPNSFMGFTPSLQMILVPLIGGSGYLYGPLTGALIVIGITYIIRYTIALTFGPALTSLVYGLLVMAVILVLREGIALKLRWIFSAHARRVHQKF